MSSSPPASGIHPARIECLRAGEAPGGPVVYWMSRDQRAADNWALLYAQALARRRDVPLAVVFCLAPAFLGSTLRQYGFMLRGLEQVEKRLRRAGIPFFLEMGRPEDSIPAFCRRHGVGEIVTDFDPLRLKRAWREIVAARCPVPLYEVDAHNIVPCRHASLRQEYAAYTLRPKLLKALPEFLIDLPRSRRYARPWRGEVHAVDWTAVLAEHDADRSVAEVAWLEPGETAARQMLNRFLNMGLRRYDTDHGNPTLDGQSNLSPYLHFGQIAAQRVALEVQAAAAPPPAKAAFMEQLIVRRELSDNFCLYNTAYDRPEGLPTWAQRTLAVHAGDPRPHLYELAQFERGETHDPLWNAAQMEMVKTGKMHNYLRMYWAKKILEWTPSPAEAMRVCIHMNDRYELDGRDPNGYAGIAWSVGGLHDRPWGERPIFGMVRYMNDRGCRSKFSVGRYIERIAEL